MIALASYAINSSHDNKRALCALRDDEAGRIRQEQQFLRVNPNGIPGLSAELIGQSIILQQQTVNALMSLDC
jgi:hypothetical protein